jgi:hypothetical protein
MRTIARRVRNLEKHSGTADGEQQILLIVCRPSWGLGLDKDKCIRILSESGYLPTGRVALVNLGLVPDGLTAEQTEMFLREPAAEMCGFQRAQAASAAMK